MKKKLLIIIVVLLAIVLAGYLTARFAVDYMFDKYFFDSAVKSVSQAEEKQEEEITAEVQTQPEQNIPPEPQPVKKKLSDSEVLAIIMKSPTLTNKMASMVSHEDKSKAVQIVLSNFTTEELGDIAKNVSKGLTAEYKSKMINIARSRLTVAQWQECLAIARKYVNDMRPYVE